MKKLEGDESPQFTTLDSAFGIGAEQRGRGREESVALEGAEILILGKPDLHRRGIIASSVDRPGSEKGFSLADLTNVGWRLIQRRLIADGVDRTLVLEVGERPVGRLQQLSLRHWFSKSIDDEDEGADDHDPCRGIEATHALKRLPASLRPTPASADRAAVFLPISVVNSHAAPILPVLTNLSRAVYSLMNA